MDYEIMTEISTIPPEPVLRLLEPIEVISLPVLQSAVNIVSDQIRRNMMTIEHLRHELDRATKDRDYFKLNLSPVRGVFQFMQGMGAMDLDRPNITMNPPKPVAPTMGNTMPNNPRQVFTMQPGAWSISIHAREQELHSHPLEDVESEIGMTPKCKVSIAILIKTEVMSPQLQNSTDVEVLTNS
jgi:hypothetical protein